MAKITTAMILAAGFGTRLRPLTDKIPKALVKVDGLPMIEHVLNKLISEGIKEVVINVHHFAGQIEKFFNKKDFGVKIQLVKEEVILGTGGGIKNAAEYLKQSGSFLVHNVDVLCDFNVTEFSDYHFRNSSLATLAVKTRKTARPLLIDGEMNVTGRVSNTGIYHYAEPVSGERETGFCGIHIISSEIFSMITEEGFFDIFTAYFRLIAGKKKIIGFDVGDCFWKDLGRPLE